MRLASFIRNNLEVVLQEWEDFAMTIGPLNDASKAELRDHAKAMLLVICKDLDTAQAVQESIDKSRGNSPEVIGDTAAESHAAERLNSGFSIEELMAEYRAMRSSVLRLWHAEVGQADEFALRDMVRFNEAIDQSLTESIARYSEIHRGSQNLFLAILGHDIRNPLGAISMGSQLLLHDDTLPDKHIRISRQIKSSATRVAEIVADLLDFATTHLGSGIPIAPTLMNFSVESSGIVDELRMLHPTCDIRLTIDGDLFAYWDRSRIGQALSNLVGNAVHHGAKDGVVWIAATGRQDEIVWTIRNEGKVISPDELRFMFDPAKRFTIKSATERSASTTEHLGLGLYVTQAIVSAHGGTIHVTSTELGGTTFTVKLPRGRSAL